MHSKSHSASGRSNIGQQRWSACTWTVFLGFALYFAIHWHAYRDGAPMRDFLSPYTGARCLWKGYNPYNPVDIARAFAAAGGQPADHPLWSWDPPVYPPSTLVELLPISLLPYRTAREVWFWLTAAAMVAALVAVMDFIPARQRPWARLLAAYCFASEPFALLLNVAQPSGLAIALAVFAWWLFSQKSTSVAARVVGIVCLGLSLGLKPQLAGLVWIALLLRAGTRPVVLTSGALKSGALALLLLLVGASWLSLAPASRTWRHDYAAQVEQSQQPGAVNDASSASPYAFQFTNAQIDLALFNDGPVASDQITYAMEAFLVGFWLILSLRRARRARGVETEWLSIAAIICIGLLPIYHREYDLALLILAFPALFLLLREHWLGLAASTLTLCLLPTPHGRHRWMGWGTTLSSHLHGPAASEAWQTLVFSREQPVLLLLLALVFLCALARDTGSRERLIPS